MRLAGYQPQYFPRLHYFNRVLDADVFGIGDYVQFVRKHAYIFSDGTRKSGKSYQAHTPIKHSHGSFLLSVPAKGKLLPINQTGIEYDKNWVFKHLKNLELSYEKAAYFPRFFPELEELLMSQYQSIAELNIRTIAWGITRLITDEKIQSHWDIKYINDLLRVKHPFRLKKAFIDSQTPVSVAEKGKASEWIISLCKYAKADEYIYGETSQNGYMKLDLFKEAGIRSVLQNWRCSAYRQQYPRFGFIPNLSIIDLVMNEDLEVRQRIILGK